MRRIEIRVERGRTARWILRLAESLEAWGAQVAIAPVAPQPQDDGALRTLLDLEALLAPRRGSPGAEPVAETALPERLRHPIESPDLVVDLTASPAAPSPGRRLLVPLYDDHPGDVALAAALFFRGTPEIVIAATGADGVARRAASGFASLEAAGGTVQAMAAVWSRVVVLLLKALDAPCGAPLPPAGTLRLPGRVAVAARFGAKVSRHATRLIYGLCCHPSHWRVGWRFPPPGGDVWSRRDLAGAGWTVLADPVDHFYADPFPLRWQGRDYLFFEDLDYKTGKGVIAATVFEDRKPGPVRTVLEEPFHLSYPFLTERDGQIWMIPETSVAREIVVYRAVEFPGRWERHAVLVSGVEASDATIVEHEGLFYLFAVTRDGEGGYSDTLAIWWAEDFFGPWHPHRENPILVDDRAARPAGAFVKREGALYRPVQDCRGAYGKALALMRVTRLDTEGFTQRLEQRLTSGPAWPGRRIHTLNFNGHLEVIDGFVQRPRWKPLADMVDRWHRPPAGD